MTMRLVSGVSAKFGDGLNGNVVERLHPLLDSAVDVLFASAPALEPGRYVLHWSVKSIPDQDDSDGTIPFAVAR
jgi:hypothetical protein